jgi:hypothetical protein
MVSLLAFSKYGGLRAGAADSDSKQHGRASNRHRDAGNSANQSVQIAGA